MKTFAALLACLLLSQVALAADVAVMLPPGTVVPEAAQPGPQFDVEKATEAYLALLTPQQRERSDSYFEGKYWLQLWNWLAGTGVAILILVSGWAVRLRDWMARRTSKPWLQTFFFAAAFLLFSWLLTLPLTIYEQFVREHQYGSSNETFGAWFADSLKSLGFLLVFGGIFITVFYALVRRTRSAWWAWVSGFTFVFLLLIIMITPVFINPVFNDYKPLPAGETREAILSMARANQVPAQDVMWYDASKQTKRISAHVAGLAGTTQIGLNDNLLEKTSIQEIKAVMAHELGHYVLNHGLRHTVYLTLLFAIGYFILDRVWVFVLARWGERMGIRDRGDPATLPIVIAILGTYLLLASPLQNRIIYAGEVEADIYGLNAAREPHAFATVAMRLASYRKLEPGPVEKWLFYDHPSGRDRVEMSMQWLEENQDLFEARARSE
jgi:STE24 endopeptidase